MPPAVALASQARASGIYLASGVAAPHQALHVTQKKVATISTSEYFWGGYRRKHLTNIIDYALTSLAYNITIDEAKN